MSASPTTSAGDSTISIASFFAYQEACTPRPPGRSPVIVSESWKPSWPNWAGRFRTRNRRPSNRDSRLAMDDHDDAPRSILWLPRYVGAYSSMLGVGMILRRRAAIINDALIKEA